MTRLAFKIAQPLLLGVAYFSSISLAIALVLVTILLQLMLIEDILLERKPK